MAKHRFNKKKYLLAIALTAIILVVATFLTIWLTGYRMIKYETNEHGVIRFLGKVSDGNIPFDGNLYFSDGTTAKIQNAIEITYSNGDVYKGEVDSLLPHGNGLMKYSGGNSYEGEFKFGYPNVKGTYKYSTGDTYTGDIKYGKKDGYGTYTWCPDMDGNSDTYQGEYKDGLRWGNGTYTWANGSVYVGTYEADSKNGSTDSVTSVYVIGASNVSGCGTPAIAKRRCVSLLSSQISIAVAGLYTRTPILSNVLARRVSLSQNSTKSSGENAVPSGRVTPTGLTDIASDVLGSTVNFTPCFSAAVTIRAAGSGGTLFQKPL